MAMKSPRRYLRQCFGSGCTLEEQTLPPQDAQPRASPSAGSPRATPKQNCPSAFENLPFDIRHEILLAVDTLEDLRALVRASPTYHGQYLLRREFWLWRSMWLEIGKVVIDAYTADRGNTRRFRKRRTRRQLEDFSARYCSRWSTASADHSPDPPSSDVVVRMAAFHLSTVQPLVQRYVAWTRTNHKALSAPEKLSRIETIRILRSLYRFQIYCNMFGRSLDTWSLDEPQFYEEEDKLLLFLGVHEPWETEEIICISTFVISAYESVFKKVEWDLHPENPKFDHKRIGPFTPVGSYWLTGNRADHLNPIHGMTHLGLGPFCATFKAKNHAQLVKVVTNKVGFGGSFWIQDTTCMASQEARRRKRLSDRDEAQDRRDKFPFRGDHADAPPLAWTTIWGETYSNLYGQYIPESPRNWGYIMWDADRLINSGGKAALMLAWKALYPPEYPDPRDEADEARHIWSMYE